MFQWIWSQGWAGSCEDVESDCYCVGLSGLTEISWAATPQPVPVSPVFTRLGWPPTTKQENISNFLFHFYIFSTAFYILGLVTVISLVMTPVLFPVLMLQHSIAFKSSDELEGCYWLARSRGAPPPCDWSLSPAGILNQHSIAPPYQATLPPPSWEGSIVKTVQSRRTKNSSDYIMWSRCCQTLDSYETNCYGEMRNDENQFRFSYFCKKLQKTVCQWILYLINYRAEVIYTLFLILSSYFLHHCYWAGLGQAGIGRHVTLKQSSNQSPSHQFSGRSLRCPRCPQCPRCPRCLDMANDQHYHLPQTWTPGCEPA